MGPVLPLIRMSMDRWPASLKRIGKYILENPEAAVHLSIRELGQNTRSGQATIMRFCRTLGFEGIRDLKLHLAGDLARHERPGAAGAEDDSLLDAMLEAHVQALRETRSLVQPETLRAVATRLNAARRIDVFGAGVSGLVAELLAYHLLLSGLTAQALSDPTYMLEIAHGLDRDCVAVAVSASGVSQDTLDMMKRARAAGAFTVAITNRSKTPLTAAADCVLSAVSQESPLTGGAFAIATGHLLIIDALVAEIGRLRR
ncbi:MurR/RpiR family transcriptional regulator [Inquilinus sp. Marseille-Q2685]|uniref:MurR/RpiR family transcriptional regulator n=1 Tax=Inquilinus sp. Marseille-Q2685 TaxID=2866581 RepID=UPI001CE48FD0|nr:MurR/RpiR family transcriptional regulator [Inquilinus sp. Marseille-Q2685]